ncbi:MAG: cytochrome C [Pseudomonadota bacterium]
MNDKRFQNVMTVTVIIIVSSWLSHAGAQATDWESVDSGRYLIRIMGCNDCHTPGYLETEGQTPEELWLTGSTFGWRGPWGTTYPKNLRILLHSLTEDQWVVFAKNLKTRPPMPWFNLNAMKDEDLRAVYKFVHHLGPGGAAAPAYLPPDKEPDPPYAVFPSPPPQ